MTLVECAPRNAKGIVNTVSGLTSSGEEALSTNNRPEKTFNVRFIEVGSKILLELINATNETLKSVEILTVFLRDKETLGGGPSQAHIRFDAVKSMQPNERTVVSHRTWINGMPADAEHDQLDRLKVVAGETNPYVLDISWENLEGKSRFQRIPVGH
jgi:hypothetical protein